LSLKALRKFVLISHMIDSRTEYTLTAGVYTVVLRKRQVLLRSRTSKYFLQKRICGQGQQTSSSPQRPDQLRTQPPSIKRVSSALFWGKAIGA